MFQGSVPQALRSIVHEHVRRWGVEDVYVGCSGNFTIERTLADQRVRLHGNDVSLYSCAIGAALAGQELDVRVSEDWVEEYGWLGEYLDTPERTAATVLLGSAMLQGHDRVSPWYERLRAAYIENWPALHAKTLRTLAEQKIRLVSFEPGDVRPYFDRVPEEAGAVTFPPFDSSGYETMFKGINAVFDWHEPEYGIMGPEDAEDVLERLSRRDHWLIGTLHRFPRFDHAYCGKVQPTARNRAMYVYASGGRPRISLPRQQVEKVTIPRLRTGDLLERLSLVKLSSGQFNSLRALYLNPRIAPAAERMAVGVLADGRLLGVFATGAPNATASYGGKVPEPYAYLLSDFPVSGTGHARLSKLVVACAQSHEARTLMERSEGHRVRAIVTTAFTDRPVSMKYRGILEMVTRKENPDGAYRYALAYQGPAGRWSLAEALEWWKAKHAR
jgi:hypothetical protein